MASRKGETRLFRDNPKNIAAYLSNASAKNDLAAILAAINRVMRAQNVKALARDAGMRREGLYRTFGGGIDPRLSRVMALFAALGVRITVETRPQKRSGVSWRTDHKAKTRPIDAAEYDSPKAVAAYLSEAFETNEPGLITAAIGTVARAPRMSTVAKDTGLSRENLYKALNSEGHPAFGTVMKVLDSMGLHLTFEVRA
jgi:probable addiction module antidote protein